MRSTSVDERRQSSCHIDGPQGAEAERPPATKLLVEAVPDSGSVQRFAMMVSTLVTRTPWKVASKPYRPSSIGQIVRRSGRVRPYRVAHSRCSLRSDRPEHNVT